MSLTTQESQFWSIFEAARFFTSEGKRLEMIVLKLRFDILKHQFLSLQESEPSNISKHHKSQPWRKIQGCFSSRDVLDSAKKYFSSFRALLFFHGYENDNNFLFTSYISSWVAFCYFTSKSRRSERFISLDVCSWAFVSHFSFSRYEGEISH